MYTEATGEDAPAEGLTEPSQLPPEKEVGLATAAVIVQKVLRVAFQGPLIIEHRGAVPTHLKSRGRGKKTSAADDDDARRR